jgi:hypothetical protein
VVTKWSGLSRSDTLEEWTLRVAMVASETWLEFVRRDLRKHQNIDSSGEVNWLIDKLGCECLPAINLAHVDLS